MGQSDLGFNNKYLTLMPCPCIFCMQGAVKANRVFALLFRADTQACTEKGIVFDRYHIMAQISREIDSPRREQFNLLDTAGQNILKGSRFLLLRNFHSLTDKNKCGLEKLLEVNRPLFIMHSMKERLRLFRRQGSGNIPAAVNCKILIS